LLSSIHQIINSGNHTSLLEVVMEKNIGAKEVGEAFAEWALAVAALPPRRRLAYLLRRHADLIEKGCPRVFLKKEWAMIKRFERRWK
jgi:hypothetical protein